MPVHAYYCQTTSWTLIGQAGSSDPRRQREALDEITRRYRHPVVAYLRRKGLSESDADDVAQGFLLDVVLARDLVGRADRSKGRFRTYLLTALNRYLIDWWRHEARRRTAAPGGDPDDPAAGPEPGDPRTPEQAFLHVWASGQVDAVLAGVEADCRRNGQAVHWLLFYEQVVRPILQEAEPPARAALCARYGLADELTVSNMVTTVKRRFRRALRDRVARELGPDDPVDEEIMDLMEILSGTGASS